MLNIFIFSARCPHVQLKVQCKKTKQIRHLVPNTTNVNELTKAYIKSDHKNLRTSTRKYSLTAPNSRSSFFSQVIQFEKQRVHLIFLIKKS